VTTAHTAMAGHAFVEPYVAGGHPTPDNYITGSPFVVSSVRKLLNAANIVDDDTRREECFGY
jgi:hypothetical protein